MSLHLPAVTEGVLSMEGAVRVPITHIHGPDGTSRTTQALHVSLRRPGKSGCFPSQKEFSSCATSSRSWRRKRSERKNAEQKGGGDTVTEDLSEKSKTARARVCVCVWGVFTDDFLSSQASRKVMGSKFSRFNLREKTHHMTAYDI